MSHATTNNTTALRWRARIVKDAQHPDLAGTNDDSRIHLSVASGEDFSEAHKKDQGPHFKQHNYYNLLGSFLRNQNNPMNWMNLGIRLMALAATFCAVVATIGHERTWWMAIHCTCTVVLSGVLLYQLERFYRLQGIRHQVRKVRQAVQRLSVQREALFRQVTQAEHTLKDLQHVESQMGTITQAWNHDVHKIMDKVAEYKVIHEQLQELLEQELQQHLMDVVLTSDADGNFELTPREWKRLKLRLQNVPGLRWESTNATNDLIMFDDDDDDEKKTSEQPTISVIQLLQHLQKSTTRTKQNNHQSKSSSPSVVSLTPDIQVRLDPQQLVEIRSKRFGNGEKQIILEE